MKHLRKRQKIWSSGSFVCVLSEEHVARFYAHVDICSHGGSPYPKRARWFYDMPENAGAIRTRLAIIDDILPQMAAAFRRALDKLGATTIVVDKAI